MTPESGLSQLSANLPISCAGYGAMVADAVVIEVPRRRKGPETKISVVRAIGRKPVRVTCSCRSALPPNRIFVRSGAIGDLAALVGWPSPDTFKIWIGIVANADVVPDRPFQACGQQDIRAVEAIAHQVIPAV